MADPVTGSKAPASARLGKKLFQPYVDAKWGLKNHWYPALYGYEFEKDGFQGLTIAGEPILLRREDGKLYAIEDRCAHRGVKISMKPHCFKKGTVTCWYHGFTYELKNGNLSTILAAPDDPLINNLAIKTYPIVERYGIIFVFVGDPDFPVPPLEHDLPKPLEADYPHYSANLTDPNVINLGIRRSSKANWRLAAENGFDPGHTLIHWKSPLIYASNRLVPLGTKPLSDKAIRFFDEEGAPKGVMNMTVPDEEGVWHYAPIYENKELGVKAKGNSGPTYFRTSMWLPGVLRVENFPSPGVSLYEWYVPSGEDEYEYWEMMSFTVKNEEHREEIIDRYDNYLKKAVFHDFNDDDVWARDAMQPFYQNGVGFDEEKLATMDAVIVAWRKFVSTHARGIQSPPKEVGKSRR